MDVDAGRVKVMEDLAGRLIESEGSAAAGAQHARPARGARGRRLRDRRDLGRRHGRVGERHRDPGALRDRHARRRLGRPGRDHARVAQRAGARRASPRRGRGRARTRGCSTTRTRRRSRRSRCAPSRRCARSGCARAPRTRRARSGSRASAGSSPRTSRCRRWSPASTTAPRCSELRAKDGTDAAAARARARHRAGHEVGARDLRRAALLLVALGRVLPADAVARGAATTAPRRA